jgi:monoamine oxidase
MKVIIIGAGAAGLMAAKELTRAGVEVVVIEALDRIGGRIHTFMPDGFTAHVEAGAEFIHGRLPLTFSLLKEAGIGYRPVGGEMYRYQNGAVHRDSGEDGLWKNFYQALNSLTNDCTVQDLLDARFPSPEYEDLRRQVRGRAQGLDLADVSRLSAFSIREEWQSKEKQYRPSGGYGSLLEYLHQTAATSANYELQLKQKAKELIWSKGMVTVKTDDKVFSGHAVIVTVPLGNLCNGDITFTPDIPQTRALFGQIGFGSVIKIALEFAHPFWNALYPDMSFLFCDEGFTFWTQLPEKSPLLTVWIGNDHVEGYEDVTDAELIDKALLNLQKVFEAEDIKHLFRAGTAFRYGRDAFSHGAYSWLTPESCLAIETINGGIGNTVWFAGEALHPLSGAALVEGALESGREIANKILRTFQ